MSRAIDAWVDGELGHGDARRVAAHVRDCWDCSTAAETTRLVKHSLRRVGVEEPSLLAAIRLRRFAEQVALA